MKCDKSTMLLYAVTDRGWIGRQTLYEQIECALKGGVTCVQLREKELGFDEFLAEAIQIKKLCNRYHIPLIINDNYEVAIKSGADGVHIGQSDTKACEVRKIIGEHMILGVTVKTVEQAYEAVNAGANYLGTGAVFGSKTKLDAVPISHDTVREICNVVSIPVVAIGGIHKENILNLSGTGVEGVALVSAIFASYDIESECRELIRCSEIIVGKKEL